MVFISTSNNMRRQIPTPPPPPPPPPSRQSPSPPLPSPTLSPPSEHPINSKSNTETNKNATSMATYSNVKSPLHNFTLTDLKWGTNQTNYKRLRKLGDKPSMVEPHSSSENPKANPVAESPKTRIMENNKVVAAGPTDEVALSEKKSTVSDGKSKILIRIRTNNPKPVAPIEYDAADDSDGALDDPDVDDDAADEQSSDEAPEEVAEDFVKTWNLRPRKPAPKDPNGNAGNVPMDDRDEVKDSKPRGSNRPEGVRSRNGADAKMAAEAKESRQRFSISLTKEEIDEDIFLMTGSKPSRRPKRRSKAVQKQLDHVFPGMWLSSITPDSYKVSDNGKKG